MSKAISIERSIASIVDGFTALREALDEPSAVRFQDLQEPFERLEKAMELKTYATLFFMWLAMRDDAGRVVHSHRPVDYFTNRLGMSYGEAITLMETAERLFGPESDPPHPNLTDRPMTQEEATRQEADREATERERAAKEEARRQLREEKAAKARTVEMLENELRSLNTGARPGRNELFNKALKEAKTRSFAQLRSWLRDQIRRANAAGRQDAAKPDPFAATRKREFWFGQQDADGGVRFGGYMDAATAAMLAKAMSPATRPGGPDLPPEEDKRSLTQRRADVFSSMLHRFLNSKQAGNRGAGSIIISATLDDLNNLTAESVLPTDTGHLLNAMDIIRLGAAATDYLCILDNDFRPLALGRGKRSASFEQYLALVATQLCCTHPGCDKPAAFCDVHHTVAWTYDGVTDINNLALMCRGHHGSNNDARDGSRNMGHMEVCPETGRVGFRAPGSPTLEFNDSPLFQYSALAKMLKARAKATADDQDSATQAA